ncbi:glycosyltransferase family 2 protein [Bacillus sp. A116_S68]|nr:glycosyltransferase family 2 protein [Bacillus sp. A116_S68]
MKNTDIWSESKKDIKALEIEYLQLKKKLDLQNAKEISLKNQLIDLDSDLKERETTLRKYSYLRHKTKQNYENLKRSRMWRLTSPIRIIKNLLLPSKNSSSSNSDTNNFSQKEKAHIKPRFRARELEKKLWGGFYQYAYKELTEIKNDENCLPSERSFATWALMKCDYNNGKFEEALEKSAFNKQFDISDGLKVKRLIAEIKVLKILGRTIEAKKLLWKTIEKYGLSSDLILSMVHISDNNDKLSWYNLMFEKNNLEKIELINQTDLPSLENIKSGESVASNHLDNYKISIVIPAYNAENYIHIPLRSLLNQTITNLEIIVVDDCSTDNTVKIVSEYEKADKRVKLIKKTVNEGAYPARNTGLKYVTGDFITIHDSDDWSHSRKLEEQLKSILEAPDAVASVSYLIRSSHDLTPVNAGSLLSGTFMMMNTSSLLVKKSAFKLLGGWDRVRVAGDTEFIWRIEKAFGKNSIIHTLKDVPLSFALSDENSLTGTSATHVKTIRFGLRRSYREAAAWWHSETKDPGKLYLDPFKLTKAFPRPLPSVIKNPGTRKYDCIIIQDFSVSNVPKVVEDIVSSENYDKIAIFHWPNYEGDITKAISSNAYRMINDNHIDILVPDEKVETNLTLFSEPEVLDYALDGAPDIHSERTIAVPQDTSKSINKELKEANVKKTMNLSLEWQSNIH